MADDSSITDAVLRTIEDRLGSSETFQKIKFGRGAVGKIAVVAVGCAFALATASFRLTGNGAVVAVIVIGIFGLCSLGSILFVIHKQPELAVLEGMELVRYKQLTMGAKGYIPETFQLPVPDPKPLLDDGEKDEHQ